MSDPDYALWAVAGLYAAALIAAGVSDIRVRKIPNWTVIALLVLFIPWLFVGPQVCFTKPKETHFFVRDYTEVPPERWTAELVHRYCGHLTAAHTLIAEGGVLQLRDGAAIERLLRVDPDTRPLAPPRRLNLSENSYRRAIPACSSYGQQRSRPSPAAAAGLRARDGSGSAASLRSDCSRSG